MDGSNYPSISETVPNVAINGNQVFGAYNLQYAIYRNTYYWDKKSMEVVENNPKSNYSAAHIYQFLETVTKQQVSPVMESEKTALENRIWYAYPNQTSSRNPTIFQGTSANPIINARVIDSSYTKITQYQYNNALNPALPTAMIDPMGGQTNYTYDSTHGIDLIKTKQNNSGGGVDVVSSATYNGKHEPRRRSMRRAKRRLIHIIPWGRLPQSLHRSARAMAPKPRPLATPAIT